MDEEDVISKPVDNLPQYDAYNPSGRGEENPPKNPSGTEAFLIISVLGVLPDVIDFFSIGALSFLSSALSWPITEYYFAQKNLKVPNVRKWVRAMNLGDVIPFLGVIPLKTTGLVIAVYIAWHPDSKLAKGAQAVESATSAKGVAKQTTAGGLKQKIRGTTQKVREYFGGGAKEDADNFELGYGKSKDEDNIYGEMSEGGQQVVGPEKEAEMKAFGEVISTPRMAEESLETAQAPAPKKIEEKPKPKPLEEISNPQERKADQAEQEQIEKRLGIGDVERGIREKLTSPEAIMENGSFVSSDDERTIDLSGAEKK